MQRVVKEKKCAVEAIDEADQTLVATKEESRAGPATMQLDFERLSLLHQVYHEAPNDVFELIISFLTDGCDNGWGWGGLNTFRLVNKRCKRVVESCATGLSCRTVEDGPESLPISLGQRCRRIAAIKCLSHNLRSLVGCPDGLKRLYIGPAPDLSDLSPLASCSMMESLVMEDSSISDISVVTSMPLLETFTCQITHGSRRSISDLSPFSSCLGLKRLFLYDNRDLKDLSPLSVCVALEELDLSNCSLIACLAPLSTLKNLSMLCCHGIDPQTSLLPLVSCTGLKKLIYHNQAADLDTFRLRMPHLKSISPWATILEVGDP